MKKTIFILTAVLAVMISSCSNGKTKVVNPTDTSFSSGELGKYVEVVEQPSTAKFCKEQYQLGGNTATEYRIKMPVTVRLKKENQACAAADLADIWFGGFNNAIEIQLEDADGISLKEIGYADGQEVKLKKLLQGHVGDTVSIIFSGNADEEIFDSFVTYSPSRSEKIHIDGSEEAFNSSSSSSSSSSDWDAVLDQYETFINQYVAVLKKVNQGDMDALSDYGEMMEDYTEFVEKLDGASDAMTAAQAARYSKITLKVTSLI